MNFRKLISAMLVACFFMTPMVNSEDVQRKLPESIIDAHLHYIPEDPRTKSDKQTILNNLKRNKVSVAFVSFNEKSDVEKWKPASSMATDDGVKIILGPSFPCSAGKYPRMTPCFPESNGWPDVDWLETELKNKRIEAIGELLFAYEGIKPSDKRMQPYYQLAVKYDVPVAFHAGHGPPERGRITGCCPNFDSAMGDPLLLEPVLEKFTNLRVLLMHGGEVDFHEQAIVLMKKYPNVYADLSIINSIMPIALYAKTLQSFIDSGFQDRLLFGSDNVPYQRIFERLTLLEFVDDSLIQKILFENSNTFFKLDEKPE